MKCSYCDYETRSLSSDEVDVELEKHAVLEHPLTAMWLPSVRDLLDMHLKYDVAVDDLMLKMKEIRAKLSKENERNYRISPEG